MKQKILIALSGGVDSSVAAALLVEAGHDVTGVFVINYNEHDKHGLPCYTKDYRDAVRVAAKLGIKLLKWDFVKEYKQHVLDAMFDAYKKGNTPNPDVLCNKFVKFGAWLEKTKEFGFDAMATGHYAVTKNGELHMAKDAEKDQTYFLHQLSKEQLEYARFPLGNYTKQEVRALAKKFDLPTAEKEESMGICFVGEVSMKTFLQEKIQPNPGNIILSGTEEEIGTHEGLPFYTIGQRHGFEQKGGDQPLFVLKKDSAANTLIVGHEDDPELYTKEISVEGMHWISGQAPAFPLECEVRLRHRQALQMATVDGNSVRFDELQKAVTPGQYAVLYKEDVCLGGGIVT